MKIRKAKEDEIENLVKVEMSSGYHKNKFDFVPYLEELFENNNEIFCAEDNDVITGYITLNNDGEIDFLAVSKKFQGKGIADLLLKKVISSAKRKKMKKIFLNVRKDNIPAINLYIKNNFTITKSYKKKISGKEILKIRMEKIIL